MDDLKRFGRQTPTVSFILPYENTNGQEAIDLYNYSGRTAQEWQCLMLYDILATNEDNLWVHTKFGYSVPRRNGKGEVITQRELYGLIHGEKILHTAHRTDTSSDASFRLASLLEASGYREILRLKKDEDYEKCYIYAKQHGVEKITLLDTGGYVDFRTRTSSGGLGRGYDCLIVDEAQEYTDDQESTLKYTVSDSINPQTIMCGTPPTNVSKGTVFEKLRYATLSGETRNTGWAEWSVESKTDVNNIDAWYECNPAMGYQLNERKVGDEVGNDDIDFNIQRLGLWLQYNQNSAISENDWLCLKYNDLPKFKGDLFVGIKYGKDDVNVSVALACKTESEKIYIEVIDCRPIKEGNAWIIELLSKLKYRSVVIDGANYQSILEKDMKENHLKHIIKPSVKEVIEANSTFTQGIFEKRIIHNNQPSVTNVITNCSKRAIGSNGGYGYKSEKLGCDIALVDSLIFAYWSCTTSKEVKKQKVTY